MLALIGFSFKYRMKGFQVFSQRIKWGESMKTLFYFFVYLILFMVGFALLHMANILDMNVVCRSELISKFLVMIIVLVAITRWGIKAYVRLSGYKKI